MEVSHSGDTRAVNRYIVVIDITNWIAFDEVVDVRGGYTMGGGYKSGVTSYSPSITKT